MASRRESLSHSLAYLGMLLPTHLYALQGLCDLAALAVTWPLVMWAPNTGSRREPKMNSNLEQAKLPGWGLWQLSSHLWAPKDCALNWSRNSGHCLLSWFGWGEGLWDGSLPFPQIVQHLHKTSFLLHQQLPHMFGFCGNSSWTPVFLFDYNMILI